MSVGFINHVPATCINHIIWAFTIGKTKNDTNERYPRMKDIVGVEPNIATPDDFQRFFKCQNLHAVDCNDRGLRFPAKCSVLPCDTCTSQIIGNAHTHIY